MDVYQKTVGTSPRLEQARRVLLSRRVIARAPPRIGEGALQIDKNEGGRFIHGHGRLRYAGRTRIVRAGRARRRTDQDVWPGPAILLPPTRDGGYDPLLRIPQCIQRPLGRTSEDLRPRHRPTLQWTENAYKARAGLVRDKSGRLRGTIG